MPKRNSKGNLSQRKKAGNASQEDDRDDSRMDSDDDEEIQETQSSQAANAAYAKMSRAEFKQKVADVCRYLLFADNKKAPIKRQDISKNVLKEHAKAFPKIMDEAKKHLAKVFGFEVLEVEIGAGKISSYMLVNKFGPSTEIATQTEQESHIPNAGLLITMLSLIFMSGGIVTEDSLWHTLKQLGLEKGKANLNDADPDKIICNDFVRKHYLEKKKVSGPEGPSFEFRWGARANTEITKRSVLQFVSKIYNVDIESWKMQYKEVLASEQQ